ncbi:hypothetical protein ACIBF5_12285 [Micromonospora sp. NPDC050417]|uniref:hypothetical protein n=1 Tax=Micromonospora sp. NPDC050417 TaxID=3364280 RepID=UPI0037BDA6E0
MPAHRRPTPPPPRPAIGVLAALLVGSAGLGVAFTAVETSDPHRVPTRTGSQTSQEMGPAAPAALTVAPVGGQSAGPTDTGAPMTPTANDSTVEARLVPDTSGSGAAEPIGTPGAPSTPRPTSGTPGSPRPTQTPRTPPTHPSSTPTVTPTPSGSPSASPTPSDPPPSTSPTPDPTPSDPVAPTPTDTVTAAPDPTRTPDPTPTGTGTPESTGDTLG